MKRFVDLVPHERPLNKQAQTVPLCQSYRSINASSQTRFKQFHFFLAFSHKMLRSPQYRHLVCPSSLACRKLSRFPPGSFTAQACCPSRFCVLRSLSSSWKQTRRPFACGQASPQFGVGSSSLGGFFAACRNDFWPKNLVPGFAFQVLRTSFCGGGYARLVSLQGAPRRSSIER